MERVVRHFQEELGVLQERLLAMGGFAEERVRESVLGLASRDAALVDRVLAGDEPINDLHIEIDDRCLKLLALHQPMAVDLRAIVSAVKINTDLERMVSIGVLRPDTPEQTFAIAQDLIDQGYVIVDISREDFDSAPQHSGDSVVRGTLAT